MDLGFLLAFLMFFLLLVQQYSTSTCPKNFTCQNIGPLEFPFSNFTHRHCGLCPLDCTLSPPKINLDHNLNPRSEWFEVLGMPKSNVIKLHDPIFSRFLQRGNCDILTHNLQLPNSASISFTTTNLTIFKCSNSVSLSSYIKLESCWGFDFYYTDSKHIGSQIPPDPRSFGCLPINLPTRPMVKITKDSNLSDLLTADFDIWWHVSDECNKCHREGGKCKSNQRNQFHCAGEKRRAIDNLKGKKDLKVIIGTSVAGGALLIALIIILILNKRRKWISFRPGNSKEPSSKLDLENGSAICFGLPVFSYRELEEVTNNFDVSKELGSGGFGIVYHGKLRDGREVAVKRLSEPNFKSMMQFWNEVEILKRLRHPNLVSLYGCTSRRSLELLLVYEYIPNGTLADHLHGDRAKDQSLTWPMRMNIAIETAGALAFLHAYDIIHRDVKTNNILLGHNFEVKVADFGLSRLSPNNVGHISTAPLGTPGYVDPEYNQRHQLTDKSDVYSFGVVLIELISSMPAVDMSRHRHEMNLANLAINRIQRHAFDELLDSSLGYESDTEILRMTTSVAELAFRCLQFEKEMRPTMDEVSETLKAIRDCKENYVGTTNETNENTAESSGRIKPASPESDEVVLLKKHSKFPSSPNAVTDIWVSGSTSTSSSR